MCGICGFVVDNAEGFKISTEREVSADLKIVLSKLLLESKARGTHSTGVSAVTTGVSVVTKKEPEIGISKTVARKLEVGLLKKQVSADVFIKDKKFDEFCERFLDTNARIVFGHTRFETKGTFANNFNNHPIWSGKVIGVHNGHINNDEELWKSTGKVGARKGKVDSEIIFHLLDRFTERNGGSIRNAIYTISQNIEGSYACAAIHLSKPKYLWLFGRMNPIYLYSVGSLGLKVFASARNFIEKSLASIGLSPVPDRMAKIQSGTGIRIDANSGKVKKFNLHTTAVCDH